MRTAILAAALLAASVAAIAQEKPKQESQVQKIVQLKYIDPGTMREILGVFPCMVQHNAALKTLSLSCPQDIMPAVEDAIRRFDVPSSAEPTVLELTAYFLVASEKPEPYGAPVPAELDRVIKQIQSVFAFKNFTLIDAELIRSANGQGGQATGQFGSTLTVFRVKRWSANQKIVSLEDVRAGLEVFVPGASKQSSYVSTGLTLGKVEVPIGEKVVIGKSSMEGPGKALVVVLSARLP